MKIVLMTKVQGVYDLCDNVLSLQFTSMYLKHKEFKFF